MLAHNVPVEETNFSIEKYLTTINLAGFKPTELSLPVLTTIIQHHLATFLYRNNFILAAGNTTPDARIIPSLNINSLFQGMITNKGGYCFQQLELLFAALTALGFVIDRHVAKVILQSDAKKALMPDNLKTHELLIIHLNSKKYIVDVGMANLSLRMPLEMKPGVQLLGNDKYRLTYENDRWTLDAKMAKQEWFCLYQFINTPKTRKEIEEAHRDTYLNQAHIPIRDDLDYTAKMTPQKRKFLFWNEKEKIGVYGSADNKGTQKKKEFTTHDEVKKYAQTKFGVN